jgi:hypothetical protein
MCVSYKQDGLLLGLDVGGQPKKVQTSQHGEPQRQCGVSRGWERMREIKNVAERAPK